MSVSIQDYDAILFDMDGVIIDSEPLWKIAMESVFHKLGSTLNKQDFQRTVGLRIDEVVHYWNTAESWGIEDEEKVVIEILDAMVELIHENPFPLVGVIETLQYLKEKDIKIGLATSSPSILIDAVLDNLNIRSYFHVFHSAETESFGKPHPAVYLKAAEMCRIKPIKCLVIEDSLTGIIAAKAAKMKVVCIPEKTHLPDPKLILADFHFENMLDLLNQFKNS